MTTATAAEPSQGPGTAMGRPSVTRGALLGLIAVAALTGVVTAASPLLGAAAVGGVVLVATAARNLQTALALWIPTLFLEALPAFNLAGKAGGAALVVAWLLQMRRDPEALRQVLRHSGWAVGILLLLLTWVTLSVLWAEDGSRALSELLRWTAVVALFVLVATTARGVVGVRHAALAFCVGGVLSALVSMTGAGGADAEESMRLGSAAGDPNFLGAWLLAALILTLTLLATGRRAATAVLLGPALVLLAVGMALTMSRGAFVAAFVTAAAGLLLLRGRRRMLLVSVGVAVVPLTLWLMASDQAWERFTGGEGGSGRRDLWTVAWEMARNVPLTGVGLDNYTVLADSYMREVGPLPASYLISRLQPDEVHNVYLQILAEAGVPGLGLLLAFVLVCLTATVRAAWRFDAAGARSAAALAYGILLAQCSLLTAGFFLSSVLDKRLWLLLALGPALSVASRARPAGT